MAAVTVDRLVASFHRRERAETPDAELLRRVDHRDEAAFEILVRRHGAAVMTAARAVLADPADIDDVFQATFLTLWRKAQHIRQGASLGCWLYGVARRAALKVHARAKRRREVESRAPERQEIVAPDLSWREACRLLHEEIDRLPTAYREPIVLCHLMGKTRDEAARELGCHLAGLRGRLERGREMLKRRLTRRGVALSAGLLTTLATEAASAALVEQTLVAARSCAATSASAIVARAIVLAAIALMSVGLIVGVTKRTADALPAMPAEKPAEEAPKFILKGRVVDAKGKPVAGAKLDAFRWNLGKSVQTTADDGGRFTLDLPGGKPTVGLGHGRLVAAAEGFAPAILVIDPQPGEMTVTLPDAVPLEGRIRTLEGQPVVGAVVTIKAFDAFLPGAFERHLQAMEEVGDRQPIGHGKGEIYEHFTVNRYAALAPWLAKPVVTDAEGRFRIPGVGANRIVDLTLTGTSIQHLNLVARTSAGKPIEIRNASARDDFTLHASPIDLLANPARRITGVVTLEGKPVAGAKVFAKGSTASAVTNEAGRYVIGGTPKSATYEAGATPPGHVAAFSANRIVPDAAGLDALMIDFALRPGIRLSGRVADARTGKPTGRTAEYFPLPGNPHLPPTRQPDGTLHVWHRAETPVAADGTFALVVAPGPGIVGIRGDGAKYIEAFLDPAKIFPDETFDRAQWGDTRTLHAPLENGSLGRSQQNYRGLVPINPKVGSGDIQLDIKLTPALTLRTRFVAPDGKPLGNVWTRGMLTDRWGGRDLSGPVKTHEFDITGLNPKRPLTFYAVHEATGLCGQYTVSGTEPQPLTLKMEPGAILTGRLVDDKGKPIVGARISCSWSKPGEHRYWPQNPPRFPETDADGKFTVPWLIAGHDLMLGAVLPRDNVVRRVGELMAPLKPGETRDLGNVTLERE